MTSPLIWIAFPLLIAVVLWFLQQKTSLVPGLATGLCVILALLAWLVPIGNAIKLGPWSVEIQPALVIFGRRFFLESSDRYFLVLLYVDNDAGIIQYYYLARGLIRLPV